MITAPPALAAASPWPVILLILGAAAAGLLVRLALRHYGHRPAGGHARRSRLISAVRWVVFALTQPAIIRLGFGRSAETEADARWADTLHGMRAQQLRDEHERVPGDDTLTRLIGEHQATGVLPSTPLEPLPVLESATGAEWEEPEPDETTERPGQPGKNGGHGAGLPGPPPFRVPSDAAGTVPAREPTSVIAPLFAPPVSHDLLARADADAQAVRDALWPLPLREAEMVPACDSDWWRETQAMVIGAQDWLFQAWDDAQAMLMSAGHDGRMVLAGAA